MINIKKRIKAFENLSEYLINSVSDETNKDFKSGNIFYDAIILASQNNSWFTIENIKYAILSLGNSIKSENINEWIKNYNNLLETRNKSSKVAVIMAGNIPLVGFHDFFYVLMSGNHVVVKLSSDDKFLLPTIANKLIEIEPEFAEYISFVDNLKSGYDAVIATGSNNSSRYFEFYFKNVPHIIRQNRNSIAVLSGKETSEELADLGNDIFMHYGKGCRNVSKIFLPDNYFIERLIHSLSGFAYVLNNSKYNNNYSYYKSIYIINQLPFYDNGFVIFKEDEALSTPVSVIHFQHYHSSEEINTYINTNKENIQCVVSNKKNLPNAIAFGNTQNPGLNDYADDVDVMKFLLNI